LKPFFQKEFKILSYDFQIYNRWGDLVFKTNDKNLGWNGIVNGNQATVGVYVYQLIVTYEKLEGGTAQKIVAGDCTLIR
jgi:large repetitive protein